MPDDEVGETPVELDGLRDLSQLHQLREMVHFGTHCVVVVCELMCPGLQIFAPPGDEAGNPIVLARESTHLVAELASCAPSLNFNFASERLELVDVAGADLVFNREQLKVELLLVCLLEEGDEELACLEHLRSQDCIQEALVIRLSLDELTCGQLL